MKRIIHITGAAGAGVTTLGCSLAQRLNCEFLDTDDFYWMPTTPPYREARPVEDRLALINRRLTSIQTDACILSGSLDGWGDPLIPQFYLVVFLTAPVGIRIERLRQRELDRYGIDVVTPGGAMYEQHKAFIEWAASYEAGTMPGRSLPRHEHWLARLPCPVVRLDGTKPLDDVVRAACQAYEGA